MSTKTKTETISNGTNRTMRKQKLVQLIIKKMVISDSVL